jgi:membrane fusion protein, multidrug efflux system
MEATATVVTVMFKRIVFTLFGLIFAFGSLYLIKNYREQEAIAIQMASLPPPIPVATAAAQSGSLPRYIDAIGTLEAVQQVVVSPEVGGRVVTLHFDSGATVRSGVALVQLNDAPERGDLDRFRAMIEFARRELDRMESITDRRAISQTAVDEAKRRLDEARAEITRTEALIAQKLIRAPFDGVLGVRKINVGEYLQPGQSVVTLTNLDKLYANFTVPEQVLGQLGNGQPVDVTADAFPERPFRATISTIEPQVAVETRTLTVQATLANREHLLRPGMFVAVRVILPPEQDVVTVPETAVDKTIYGDSVLVVHQATTSTPDRPSYTAKRVFVKTGRSVDGRIVIREGITPGDLIITAGQVNLNSGMPVSLSPTDTLAEHGNKANAQRGAQLQ